MCAAVQREAAETLRRLLDAVGRDELTADTPAEPQPTTSGSTGPTPRDSGPFEFESAPFITPGVIDMVVEVA